MEQLSKKFNIELHLILYDELIPDGTYDIVDSLHNGLSDHMYFELGNGLKEKL